MAHPGGRPQMYTPEQIEEIRGDLESYIETKTDPTIVGFTSSYVRYSVNKDYISDHEEFSELRKRAIEKQEAYLLENATTNKANATVAIFRLKQPQHGFKDRVDSDITSGGEKIEVGLNAVQAEQLIRARASREPTNT